VSYEILGVQNVTISMDEETLRWVRVEAARAGLSVSRWIAGQLQRFNRERAEKVAASARIIKFLEEFPGIPLSENGKINIDRDELYDDGRFRRFDDPDLSAGQGRAGESEPLRGVAEDPEGG
jgi:predicted nucleic acid-binding protein